jgi:8-oxo-dGTP diphosphatase
MRTVNDWQAALEEQARQAREEGRGCIVGGLIVDSHDRLFVYQRSFQRRLFPGCWDIPGGHVEPGESLAEALAREVYEETGWTLERIIRVVEVFDYEVLDSAGELVTRRVFDFLIEVVGDLERPLLEPGEAIRFLWVGDADLELLKENRDPGDETMIRLVHKALLAGQAEPA